MFFFKVGKEKKSSKNFNCHERPEKNNNYFYEPVTKQNACNKCYKKIGFFSGVLFCLLLIPGYSAAFWGGLFNSSDIDFWGGGSITLSEIDDTPDGNGTSITINDGSVTGKNSTNSTFSAFTHNHTVSNFSCSELKNPDSRALCKKFTRSKDGYSVRYLGKNEFFREHDSFTIYIIPPGEIWFNDTIRIEHAKNVAIIGEADDKGNYPTLRGSKKGGTMLEWINCQNCMLANVNIDPTTESGHSLAFSISGENTEVEFRNIQATHSRTGLLYSSSAKSITLENVGTSFEPENDRDITPPVLYSSAISIHNCPKIKAKNVSIHDVLLDSKMKYPYVIDILNPEEIDFDGIYIGLTKHSVSTRDMAYIGLAFSDMDNYSRAGGSVKALMKELHLGVYTGGDKRDHITVPELWPVNRHILSLSERNGSPADTTKVKGLVTVEANDYIQQTANKPGMQKVSGEDLFYNLKVTWPGLISPALDIFTPNSLFIPNSTSSPRVQKQQGEDDSGMSTGATIGTAFAVVVATVVTLFVGYRYRKPIRAAVMSAFGIGANKDYKHAIFNADDQDAIYRPTTVSNSDICLSATAGQ